MSREAIEPETARTEVLTGGLLYLMTVYQRTQCPCVARAISHHLEHLAHDPDADPVVRDVCTRLRGEWLAMARADTHAAVRQH